MTSVFDQENLVASHQTTAASKPLNQAIRSLQPKTPGNNLKTPFRIQNDENSFLRTGKPAKDTFVTPGPAPKTGPRAVLGAKTANAKGQAFQTPAPNKTNKPEKTAKKASSARRTIKKKIYVEPEQPVETNLQEPEEENEPDYGYAPAPEIPLPDPPIEFDYDQTYAALRPENFNRGVGEIYFQSPKDQNGFSLSLKKIEEEDRRSLQRDLDKILEEPISLSTLDDIDDEAALLGISTAVRSTSGSGEQSNTARTKPQESSISTLRSRGAVDALTRPHNSGVYPRMHARLPSAATAQTTSSKQKRKSTFAVAQDTEQTSNYNAALPVSKTTIGFPKAKKPPSILPRTHDLPTQSHARNKSHALEHASSNDLPVSPRRFVELNGQPSVESDLWVQLKGLEIRNRRRDDEEQHDLDDPIFDFDEAEVDHQLSMGFRRIEDEETEEEDFELTLD